MARVVLDRLVKTYPEKSGPGVTAVKGVSLAIEHGEFMVLVGPSGCGKSTTLRMIAGLEEISGGTLAIDGRVVNDVAPKDRDIAMVFQNYALYPHMTVRENMAFSLRLRKLPAPEIEARVAEAAELLQLGPYLDRHPKALSGGQRQRVAVGRAIVRQPKVFLFDEPLSNLDAKMRVSMRAEISRLHTRLGATMIYVTHDQVEAMTMGDRICVMQDGHIRQVADPMTLYRQPANSYVASFIGSPPMNLLRGRIETAGGRPVFVEGGEGRPGPVGPRLTLALPAALASLAQPGRDVIFGLRPEEISHQPNADTLPVTLPIDLAETLGAETHLHLASGGHAIVARIAAPVPHHLREITTHWRLNSARLFDAASGDAL